MWLRQRDLGAEVRAIGRRRGDRQRPRTGVPQSVSLVVAEWGDFQCPFCRLYTLNTEPALLRQYVDSGQVRLEWHDFAYPGPESVLGARAARAAGAQGKFWAFHDALYRDQARENTGAVTGASLSATAARLGLDVPRFQRDDANPAIAAAVTADRGLRNSSAGSGARARTCRSRPRDDARGARHGRRGWGPARGPTVHRIRTRSPVLRSTRARLRWANRTIWPRDKYVLSSTSRRPCDVCRRRAQRGSRSYRRILPNCSSSP